MTSIRVVAALIVATALSASHWEAYTLGTKGVQADWDRAVASSQINAAEKYIQRQITKEKAVEARTKILMANIAAADSARTASNRLRIDSERSLQSARDNHAACIVSATTHAQLFDYCQREYRAMAKAADGHATDSKTLIESWPK